MSKQLQEENQQLGFTTLKGSTPLLLGTGVWRSVEWLWKSQQPGSPFSLCGLNTESLQFETCEVTKIAQVRPQPMVEIRSKKGRVLEKPAQGKVLVFSGAEVEAVSVEALEVGSPLLLPRKVSHTSQPSRCECHTCSE